MTLTDEQRTEIQCLVRDTLATEEESRAIREGRSSLARWFRHHLDLGNVISFLGLTLAFTAIVAGATGFAASKIESESIVKQARGEIDVVQQTATRQINKERTIAEDDISIIRSNAERNIEKTAESVEDLIKEAKVKYDKETSEYMEYIRKNIYPPIGSIVAWHESLQGTPEELPEGWLKCDGKECRIKGSPYFGQSMPALNGPARDANAGGRFLRGGTTSGTYQEDAFQDHGHESYFKRSANVETGGSGCVAHGETPELNPLWNVVCGAVGLKGTVCRTSSETRPVNMTVVWIIRVK